MPAATRNPLGQTGFCGPILLLACLLAIGCREPASIRPDLVLITIDGLLAESLECYGGSGNLGAEICALGETGARYVWAFAAAPLAAPSAASVLSSRYPRAHGVGDSAVSFMRHGTETLQEQLRQAGYRTAAFVESPSLNRSRNFQQGFDSFDDRSAEQTRPRVGERALLWATTAGSPWFMWVHFSLDRPAPTANSGNASMDGLELTSEQSPERALRELDRSLSQLIAVLDARESRPGILLAALHGRQRVATPRSNRPAYSVSLSEIRVPLLWRPPRTGTGSGVGRRVTLTVSLLDVAPTLLEAAGLRPPPSFEGEPLPHDDTIGAAGTAPARAIFAEHPSGLAVIRDGEYAAIPRYLWPPDRDADPPEGRTARLWPAGDRTSESVPRPDHGQESRERLARLRPLLLDFDTADDDK